MKAKIHAVNANYFSSEKSFEFVADLPANCPCCETSYSALPHSTILVESSNETITAYSVFFCPSCEECFFACYDVIEGDFNYVGVLHAIYPHPASKTVFSSSLQNLSPSFIKIYNQAEQAEVSGLNEIAGLGYRKSLEFLVKDYAISIHPDKKTEIEASLLGNCISMYIENEKIKALAKASSWLGNDEAHYTRKHKNYNIDDLKRFINTIIAFIDYESNYLEALHFLSGPQ